MGMRILTVTAMAVLGLFGSFLSFSVSAQTDPPPSVSAPLAGSVSVPAAGEQARLEGAVSVRSSLRAAGDGESAVLSYGCDSAGGALGERSGMKFTVTGSDSGSVPVVQALPTDVGLSCSMALVSGDVRQQFLITLQAGVDATGMVTSVVIRTISAL